MDAIGEWVERIAGARPALGSSGRFRRCDLTRLNPVLLAGTDSPGDPVLGEHDGVGVHMATDPPCERCVGEFLRRGLPITDDGPIVGLGIETVILLDQETVGHLPDRKGRCRIGHRHGEDAGVLSFADQLLDDPVLIAGGQDHIGLCRIDHRLHGGEIHDPVGGDDAAERRTRVAFECPSVRRGEIGGDGGTTRVGVLHDRNRRLLTEIVGETPCRIGIEEVEIAEGHATVLFDRIPDARLVGSSVTGALLVRVLAIAQDVGAFEGEMDRRGQRLRLVGGLVEPGNDCGVVGGGVREGVAGERTAGCIAEGTQGAKLGENIVVPRRVDDHADLGVILRRRSDHCGATDIDQFLGATGSVLKVGHARPERVEVADDEIDRVDVVFGHVGLVFGVGAIGEDPTVHLGMEGDDPMPEHDR